MEKIALHPLVVMNMSDHFTRAKYRNKVPKIKVIGLILGNQKELTLEISNSIEMKRDEATGEPDIKFALNRVAAYRKIPVFKDLEIIGWYSVDDCRSDQPTTHDFEIHQKFIS
jgi:COP9 signalosome complex subunit 6